MKPLTNTSIKKKISCGVLMDSLYLKRWQLLCIQKLMDEQNVELQYLLLNNSQGKKINKFKKYSGNKTVYHLYEKSLTKLEMLEVVDCSNFFKNIEKIQIAPEQKKGANYFEKAALETIKEKSTDFLIRFGFGILKGEILDVPKYGIWSFHHGDMELWRGGPMGFWEIILMHYHQGAVLQKLNHKLDGGTILHQGKIELNKHSPKTNINTILKVSTDWPVLVCRNILLNGEEILPKAAVKNKAPLYKVPSNFTMLKFAFRILKHKILFHYQQLFRAEEWNIGILNKKIEEVENKDIPQIRWASKNSTTTYMADPFYFKYNGEKVIFEEFDYASQKGKISSLQISDGAIKGKIKMEVSSEHHLSYPFIFEKDNKIHLFPESFGSKQQLHFEWNDQWSEKPSIIKNEVLIDSSIFFYNNKYWLWGSKKDLLNNAGLYLYFSDSLNGEFISHPLNPVKTDIRSARPAGTPFVKNGKLYRPAQNCSKTYGGSITINEVTALTTTSYSEKTVRELFPDSKGKYFKGLHTLSAAGENTLMDGKRYIFSFPNFKHQLQRKISKLVGR